MNLEHVNLVIAAPEDAVELLELQKKAFKKYSDKYGDFDSNPYHMNEKRILFNINYRYGKYYKILNNENGELIGGIFWFLIDEQDSVVKIAQFYLKEEYRSLGLGKEVLSGVFKENPIVKKWYVDTIFEEEYNVRFYQQLGFEIIDYEIEHEGLTFVTLLKK
jgi:GNAT superfamily N-acetyltransferase